MHNNGNIISTSNQGAAYGMHIANANDSTIDNSGTVIVTSYDSVNSSNAQALMLESGDDNEIINSGIITANQRININSYAYSAIGIYIASTNNSNINNSGIITANSAASNAFGIWSEDNTVTLNNSGIIRANGFDTTDLGRLIQSAAIDFTGGGVTTTTYNNTINYDTSGYVVGRIVYGSGAGNVLHIADGGRDRDHLITYIGSPTVNIDSSLIAIQVKQLSAAA